MPVFGDLLVRRFKCLYPLSSGEEAFLRTMWSRTSDFSARQDIYCEGARPDSSALLLSGLACRYRLMSSGTRQIIAFIVPGDLFDTQSFLLRTLDHGIASISPCTAGLIKHKTLMEITRSHHGIALGLWKATLIEGATSREWIVNVGQRNAHARIAHVMCEIYARLAVVGHTADGGIPWPITQSALGDATGLTQVHVNRTLKGLRSDGLITLENRWLTIHDWDGLCRRGEFENRYLHLSPAA